MARIRRLDKIPIPAAFKNAGTAAPAGRAQRMADHTGHVDDMVQEEKIPRSKIRRHRPGAFNPQHKTNRA